MGWRAAARFWNASPDLLMQPLNGISIETTATGDERQVQYTHIYDKGRTKTVGVLWSFCTFLTSAGLTKYGYPICII